MGKPFSHLVHIVYRLKQIFFVNSNIGNKVFLLWYHHW